MADIAASADSTLPSPLQIPEFKRPDVMTAGEYVLRSSLKCNTFKIF